MYIGSPLLSVRFSFTAYFNFFCQDIKTPTFFYQFVKTQVYDKFSNCPICIEVTTIDKYFTEESYYVLMGHLCIVVFMWPK